MILSFFIALNPMSKCSGIIYDKKEISDETFYEFSQYVFSKDLSFLSAICETYNLLIGEHYNSFNPWLTDTERREIGAKGILDYLISHVTQQPLQRHKI